MRSVCVAAAALAVMPSFAATRAGSPSLDEIVSRFEAAEQVRFSTLESYSAVRRYVLVNHRFHKRADLTVRVNYASTGVKGFEVISGSGPGVIRNKVLKKMVEAEAEASQPEVREQVRLSPRNYTFALLGTESIDGRPAYVLEATPKREHKFMMRGMVWIDAEEYAVVKIDGAPAKNPSFLIRGTTVAYHFKKHGRFFLPALNVCTTDVRIFGKTDVTVEYSDYRIQGSDEATVATAAE